MKTLALILISTSFCFSQSKYLSFGLSGGVSNAKTYKPDACFGINLGAGLKRGRVSFGLENGVSNINYFREAVKTDALGNVLPNKISLGTSLSYYKIALPVSVSAYKSLSVFAKPSYDLCIGANTDYWDGRNYSSRPIDKQNTISVEGGLKLSVGGKNKVELGVSYLKQIKAQKAYCFLLSIGYRINSK